MKSLEDVTKKMEQHNELCSELGIMCRRYAENIMLPDLNDKPSHKYEYDNFAYGADGEVVIWLTSDSDDSPTCRFVSVKNVVEHWNKLEEQGMKEEGAKITNMVLKVIEEPWGELRIDVDHTEGDVPNNETFSEIMSALKVVEDERNEKTFKDC